MSNDNIAKISKLLKLNNVKTPAENIIERFRHFAFNSAPRTYMNFSLIIDSSVVEIHGEKHHKVNVITLSDDIILERTEEYINLISFSVNDEKININETIC